MIVSVSDFWEGVGGFKLKNDAKLRRGDFLFINYVILVGIGGLGQKLTQDDKGDQEMS